MKISGKIAPFLWFDKEAAEAAAFYTSVFPDSKVLTTTHYTSAGQEVHNQTPGSVMTVEFELNGQRFVALNAGPLFKFSEAISFEVPCKTQEDIDYFWNKLSSDPRAEQCGWLKDKFGLSWQIVPSEMADWVSDSEPDRAGRVMTAMLQMKKLDIARLKQAYEGQ
jgi:predicted 3-demethylubiquinone-9 3-methyltransferase (glyoxalase superfamily)